MQIKGLHKSFYSIYKWSRKFELDEKILKERDEAKKPYIEKVQKYEEISKKCKDKDLIFKYSGISRATYFRYKKVIKDIDKGKYMPKKIKNKRKNIKNYTAIDKKIAEIRIESDNIYGRDKIATILRRDHKIFLSASTVGRRMKKLFEQGVIEKYSAKNKPRKPRKFDKHAKRWDYDKWKNVSKPGECIQIDHMSVTVDGKTFKHFAAIDKISKVIVAKVVSNATSNAASKFLDQVMEKMPWSKTIQVDGGSEFMLHFEEKCKQINLELVVLRAKKAQNKRLI
jgi:putative transposase